MSNCGLNFLPLENETITPFPMYIYVNRNNGNKFKVQFDIIFFLTFFNFLDINLNILMEDDKNGRSFVCEMQVMN